MTPEISVIIPTHNPDPGRLREVMLGLRAQSLPADAWETLLIDNASDRFPDAAWLSSCAPSGLAVEKEHELGLSAARRRGFLRAAGRVAVLVDDDNVLAPGYLEEVLRVFDAHPRVGAAGGRSSPRFESEPPAWALEFLPLLALRDPGPAELISNGLRPAGASRNHYPEFAPIGAGMALRRAAWTAWLDAPGSRPGDRRGTDLSSAGDNDIVLCAMAAGWEVGYFPSLSLTHIIPAARLRPAYLARLNRGIQKSWMQVLARHEANPWPPLSPRGAALRRMKAWFAHRPWSSPQARIRWNGACGHFEGRVATGRR